MKGVFVVSQSAESPIARPERRHQQRRMGLPRRIVADRREAATAALPDRRESAGRRSIGSRRRRPDRRIGLSPDLDLYLLGI